MKKIGLLILCFTVGFLQTVSSPTGGNFGWFTEQSQPMVSPGKQYVITIWSEKTVPLFKPKSRQ